VVEFVEPSHQAAVARDQVRDARSLELSPDVPVDQDVAGEQDAVAGIFSEGLLEVGGSESGVSEDVSQN
jgi:hypothetical protein